MICAVPRTGDSLLWDQGLERRHLVRRQRFIESAQCIEELSARFRADDRHEVRLPRECPRNEQLSGRHTAVGCETFEAGHLSLAKTTSGS